MEEIKWKSVLGLEDKFEVTKDGDIKSLKWHRTNKEKVLNIKPREDGYIRIHWRDGKRVLGKYLHIAVWEAFNGEVPNGYDVHHINHNPSDNRLENLELITKTEHAIMHNKDKIGIKYKKND